MAANCFPYIIHRKKGNIRKILYADIYLFLEGVGINTSMTVIAVE
tara:strand:- start:539 stop:673 length:135 start_codon:yes stop_codon:yes gene_type:complete